MAGFYAHPELPAGESEAATPWARTLAAVALAALAYPWFHARVGGPSSSVEPWLASALCAALVALLLPGRIPRMVLGVLAVFACWAFLRSGAVIEVWGLVGACAVIGICAAAGGGDGGRPLERAGLIAGAWLIAAALNAVIALAQYFGLLSTSSHWLFGASAGEALGNLRQRNQFASLTVIGFPALLWLVRGNRSHGGIAAAIALAILLAAANAATTSRTGALALVLLAPLTLWWARGTGWRVPLLVGVWIGAYAVAALLLPIALERVTGLAAPSLWQRATGADNCSSRTVLWTNVLHLIAQKPWTGWGWGELDYAHFATLYPGSARFCDILDNAHNLPLHLAVELGLPAAVMVTLLALAVMIRSRFWCERERHRQMAWAVLLVLALHSLLEYPLWYGPFQIAFGLCLGLLRPAAPVVATGRSSWHHARLALPILLAGACLYAAWDYQRVSQIYLPPEQRRPAYRSDPLAHALQSRLFRNQALFAELTLSSLSARNAAQVHDASLRLLHYSPEPRVIEMAIESALMLGYDDEALLQLARYRRAFPQAEADWAASLRRPFPP